MKANQKIRPFQLKRKNTAGGKSQKKAKGAAGGGVVAPLC